jgi:hypothetical protein
MLFAIEIKLVDSKVVFPKYTVDGKACYTEEEKDSAISQFNPEEDKKIATVKTITPLDYEVNLATCVGEFQNTAIIVDGQQITTSDFHECLIEGKYLNNKITLLEDQLLREIDTKIIKDLIERITWLKHYKKMIYRL